MGWWSAKSPASSADGHRPPGAIVADLLALLARLAIPLAILAWFLWLPPAPQGIPEDWDPQCPEWEGDWVEVDLDAVPPDQVTSRSWVLPEGRLLLIEYQMQIGNGIMSWKSRPSLLDIASGDLQMRADWQTGYLDYWPQYGLSLDRYDKPAGTITLERWDLETLTNSRSITVSATQWQPRISPGLLGNAQFRASAAGGWEMLAQLPGSFRQPRVEGYALDAAGQLIDNTWTSEIVLESAVPLMRIQHDTFSAVTMDTLSAITMHKRSALFLPDPETGWPTRVVEIAPQHATEQPQSRLGHIPYPLGSRWGAGDRRAARTVPIATIPHVLTDADPPLDRDLQAAASYWLGWSRLQVQQRLYSEERLSEALPQWVRLQDVRLVDQRMELDCAVDSHTLQALRLEGGANWRMEDYTTHSFDPLFKLQEGGDFWLPLQTFALPGNRLLVLHLTHRPGRDPLASRAGPLRIGVVANNQLTWLGWVTPPRESQPYMGEDYEIARQGDQLLLLRNGQRWNNVPYASSFPTAWLALPLPPELEDLPEGQWR